MHYDVSLRQPRARLPVELGSSILEAALKSGIDFPHGCRAGNCGACKCELLTGEVELSPYSEFALTDEERAEGRILACRAVPWSDCEIAIVKDADVAMHPSRNLMCEVAELSWATHDIRRVRLAIRSGGPFDYTPGQYARVTFSGCEPRPYSMASQPGEPIEFHIRLLPGGSASAYACNRLAIGETVDVSGPLGSAHLRRAHEGPIVAVAGGSGLAPIKSIIDAVLAADPQREIQAFFGVRAERDLYLLDHFERLAVNHSKFSFVPVLSDGPAGDWHSGWVADAVHADVSAYPGAKAYLAGPPPMVETVTATLLNAGFRRSDIHADAFTTLSDQYARAA